MREFIEKNAAKKLEDEAKNRLTSLTLKWGTLKSWNMNTAKGKELLKEYHEIGSSAGAMTQRDTPRQKEIICEMIDECDGDTIYLHWDGVDVPKQQAKDYVLNYHKK